MIKKLLLTVFLVVNLFFARSMFGQAVGDYRSNVNPTGNWTNITSWHRWSGSSWIQPTVAQGYPGQNIGTGAVFIQAGDVITIGTSGIATQDMGTITINGELQLFGDNNNVNFVINTPLIVVTEGLSPLANIYFEKKATLALPVNATILVGVGGLPSPGSGDPCNNNIQISIGGVVYAYCTGGSSASNDFGEIMGLGGTGGATSNSPVCSGTIINFSATSPPNGGPFIYVWAGPNGFSSSIQNPSINSSSLGIGTYSYSVTMTSTTLSSNKSITVQTTVVVNSGTGPTAPTLGTITQPTCTLSTGSVILNGLPASGTWTLTRSPGAIQTTGTGTSTTISGLAYGNYTYTVSNGSCTSLPSSLVPITSPEKTWNGSVSSDWNTAANWTPSGVPTPSNCVTIPNTAMPSIISGTNFVAYANTLTLLTAGRLTVDPSNTIVVTDFVSADLGFLVFENSASLVQINNANNNSGFIDYKRTTSARKTDYTYWSSPVSPMTLGELYTLGGTFYSYEPSVAGEDWSPSGEGTEMVAGKGYIANRGASIPLPGPPPPPDLLNVIFTGVPNNGHYEINGIYANKSYLLGNPYPSALDADTFLNANADVLNGTLYFWTHHTQIGVGVSNPGTGVYAYSGNDYASYNATGGVAANQRDIDLATGLPYPNPGGGGSAPSGSEVPTGKIASGQGFFASSKTGIPVTSKIIYDNTMRVGVNGITGNNSQFFKTKNPNKSSKPIEKNRIWLNLTNIQGAFKQTLIGYITDATNEYDDRFDGESFDANEFVDFYSVNQDKNLVIQGRALPFDENDEVPLGFRTTINGAFTINIDQIDGLLSNQAVFIEDKLTNTIFDLKGGNYTFNTLAGTFDDRFVLRFKDNSTAKTLAASNFDSVEKTILVTQKNRQIKIDSAVERIDKVTVFDLLGRQIYQKENVNSNEWSISNLLSNRQMLMVKTTLQNGKTVTKKIIY